MGLDGPLARFADAVVGKLIEVEAAEASYIEAIGGRREEVIGAVCVVHERLPHPAFNQALSLDAEGSDATVFLRRIENTFGPRALPFQLVVSPLSQPGDLEQMAAVRGYLVLSRRLWMELNQRPPSDPEIPRLTVEPTHDTYAWADTCARGLDLLPARDMLQAVAHYSARAPRHALLIARWEGHPVGAVEVSVDEGVAVLRRLAVVEQARERPVARALIHAACEHAYANDAYRTMTRVFQGSGAQPLMESLGFGGTHLSADLVLAYPPYLLD
jgi:GNAT superfamily N-acetyltransferase